MFMRGDYDVAVFQSFKEVEVAVREAARMSNSDIGRKLMQAAFNPDTGPLMIVGGESGPSAREMRPEWSESFKIALKEDVLHREWNDFPLSSSFAVAAE
jgi:protein gp37